MYLIRGIRFGSWKDRRLNRASEMFTKKRMLKYFFRLVVLTTRKEFPENFSKSLSRVIINKEEHDYVFVNDTK